MEWLTDNKIPVGDTAGAFFDSLPPSERQANTSVAPLLSPASRLSALL